MKLIKNTGDNRVIDEVRAALGPQSELDIATPAFSLFAFAEARELLEKIARCRLVIPTLLGNAPQLFGGDADRPFRNRLNTQALARQLAAWVEKKVELRGAPMPLPQSLLAIGNSADLPARVLTGHCAFTTDGLGITPGNQFSLIQCAESKEECAVLSSWFDSLWAGLPVPEQQRTRPPRIVGILFDHFTIDQHVTHLSRGNHALQAGHLPHRVRKEKDALRRGRSDLLFE